MKKLGNSFFPSPGAIDSNDEIMKMAGLPPLNKGKEDMASEVAKMFSSKKKTTPAQAPSEDDVSWEIQKKFITLFEVHGKTFARFIGDFLDVLLSGPLQEKMVSELIEEKIAQKRRLIAEMSVEEANVPHVPPAMPPEKEVKIGGEERVRSHHFLKRKKLLATIFVDSREHPAFKRIVKNIDLICQEELDCDKFSSLSSEEKSREFQDCIFRLKREISRNDLLIAWFFLKSNKFQDLELIFTETRSLGLLRPSYYEDLDKAYRDGKKLLKLLVKDFETEFPPLPEKKEGITNYLNEVLEIYTFHHFVVKSANIAKPTLSKKEMLEREELLQSRIDELNKENERLREEKRRLILDREGEVSEKSILQRQNEELKSQVAKLDPAEVSRQIRAMEAKVNQNQREYQEMLEENSLLRATMRTLDTENQDYLQKLRELNAIPDESAKSVKDLLIGKRVVIFGGVGRDHYLALLKEAGVKECDYEWYDGYRTISQSRTAEIVRRCDLVVVITAYAGHLHTWQTRSTVTDQQKLVFIHNSGSGTLRTQILENYKIE
ncbi:MAG: hypothetical protein HQM10_02880 [Candidatus Riflebacteria bacterium]|nr:hypothetical protein [Candidatus Riflebacteria bacterium]